MAKFGRSVRGIVAVETSSKAGGVCRNRRGLVASIVTAAVSAAVSWLPATQAATLTWVGGTNSFSTNTNWSPTNVPGAADTALFNGAGGGNTTIDVGGAPTVNAFLFDTGSAAGYTIGAGAPASQSFTLGSSVNVTSTVTNAQIFNAKVNLLAGSSAVSLFDNSTTASLSFAGGVVGLGTGTSQTLFTGGAGNVSITGGVSGNTGFGLSQTGPGTLTITGSSVFGGAVTVSGGKLGLTFDSAPSETNSSGSLAMLGAVNVTVTDAAGATDVQNFGNLTLGIGHYNTAATNGVAQLTAVDAGATSFAVNLGTITRANQAPGINFTLPAVGSITTTQPLTNGIIGGYATVNSGTVLGSTWATTSGGAIVGLQTAQYANMPDAVTSSGASYTTASNVDVTGNATVSSALTVNSIRFNTPVPTSLTLFNLTPATANSSVTNVISSGGILMTENVGLNNVILSFPGATGEGTANTSIGILEGPANGELIITQNDTQGSLSLFIKIPNNGGSVVGGDTALGGGTVTGLTKLGPGTLILGHEGNYNSFTGSVAIYGGTVTLQNAYNLSRARTGVQQTLLGDMGAAAVAAGKTITVYSGATLNIGGGTDYIVGGVTSANTTLVPLILDGGTVKQSSVGGVFLPSLILMGGTVQTANSTSATAESMVLFGSVTVSGTAPSTFTGGTTFNGINIGGNAGATNGGAGNFIINSTGNTGAADLTIPVPIANSLTSGTAGNINKTGLGIMSVSGANIYTGTTTVGAGIFNYGGSLAAGGAFTVGNTAATNAILNVTGNVTEAGLAIGATASNAYGAVFQTGTLTNTQAVAQTNIIVGAVGSGYYNLSTGTLTNNELTLGGTTGSPLTSVGVMDMVSGTYNGAGSIIIGRSLGGSTSILNVIGSAVNLTGTALNGTVANPRIILGWGSSGVPNVSVLNIASALTGPAISTFTLSLNDDVGGASNAASLSVANVNTGGTLTIAGVSAGATGTSFFNFVGGTLKATSVNAGAAFLASPNITHVEVFGQGGTVDNNGTSITIGNALQAPVGSGVTSFNISNGGSGFIGAPAVVFSGGGGSGATGYAVLTNRAVSNVVITSPGIGYTSPATISFVGGSNGSVLPSGTVIIGANSTTGGMTFNGVGTTSLSGISTYQGATIVNNGTLLIATPGSINTSSGVTVNSGRLTQNSTTAITTPVTINTGILAGAGTLSTVIMNGSGAVDFTSNIASSGTPAFTINTALTLNGTIALNLFDNDSTLVPGTYKIFSHPGSLTGSAANLSLGNGFSLLGGRQSASFTDTGPGGVISLVIIGDNPTWTGLLGGTWATGQANGNWRLPTSGGATNFLTSDIVTFDDSAGAGFGNVNISAGNVSPSRIYVNNNTLNYVISGGGIADAGGSLPTALIKTGTGSLTVSTNNSYLGGTTINGGVVSFTGNNTFGGGVIIVNNSSTATFTGTNSAGNATVTSGSLTMSGTNTLTGGINITGTGVFGPTTDTTGVTLNSGLLTMNGTNNFGSTGVILIKAGVASFGPTTSQGGLTVNTGTVNLTGINDFGSSYITVTSTSNTTFTGSSNNAGGVTLTTGTVSMSGNFTFSNGVTVNSGTMTLSNSGTIGSGGVTVAGGRAIFLGDDTINGAVTINGGTATLAGNNTIPNGVTLNGGTLFINNGGNSPSVSAIGSSTFQLKASTIDNTSGSPVIIQTFNPSLDWVATAASTVNFLGSSSLGFPNSGLTLDGAQTFTLNVAANNLSLGGGISSNGATALVKTGTGTLVLSGSSSSAAGLEVDSGKIILTSGAQYGSGGGRTTVGGTANTGNATFLVDGGTFTNSNGSSFQIGANATGGGLAIFQNNASGNVSGFGTRVGNGGYGNLMVNSGSTLTYTATSSGLLIGNSATGVGIVNIAGGNITVNDNLATDLGEVASARGILNLTSGALNIVGGGSATRLRVGAIAGGIGTFNVSGTGVATIGGGSTALGLDIADAATAVGIVNLGAVSGGGSGGSGGGLINTDVVQSIGGAGGTSLLNFHGGTLQAENDNATFISGLTRATVYSEGGTIDNNGTSINIGQALLAPSGSGVGSFTLSGGSGYLAEPAVVISGGGGTGATAIAVVNAAGTVTQLIITNPGTGYTAPATVSFIGSTLSVTAATATATMLLNAQGGGLTFAGTGTTSLTAVNTYTGPTVVQGGTLKVTAPTQIGDATFVTNTITLNNGKLDLAAGTGFSLGANRAVTLTTGGTGTVQVDTPGANYTIAGAIGGGGSLVTSGLGTVTLTGTSNYSGSTSITGGLVGLTPSGGLILAGTSSINGSNGVTVGQNATLVLNSSVAMTPSLLISQGGKLTTAGGTGASVGSTTITGAPDAPTGRTTLITASAAAPLTFSNLAFTSQGSDVQAEMNLVPSTVNPALKVTNTLTLPTSGTVEFKINVLPLVSGTYQLMTFGGVAGATFQASDFALNLSGVSQRTTKQIVVTGGGGGGAGTVSLQLGNDNPRFIGSNLGGAPGVDPGILSTSTSTGDVNLKLLSAGTPTQLLNGDFLTFDDQAATTNVHIVDGTVSLGAFLFQNTTKSFTIDDSGTGNGINGTGFILVTGTGTSTISTNNTYTGGTTVSNGLLTLSGNNNFGIGGFLVSGGTLNLTGSNNLSGITSVNAGKLIISNASALNGSPLALSGGTIDAGAPAISLFVPSDTWSGSFTFAGTNSLDMSSVATTLAGNTTVNTVANQLGVGGISDGGFGYSLTKIGAGTLFINSDSTFSGGVTLNAGVLIPGSSQALGATTQVVSFGSGSPILHLNNMSVTLGGISGTSATAFIENGGASNVTMTLSNPGSQSFAGTIRDGSGGGKLAVTINAAGTQALSGNNSYSGGTDLILGDLAINSATALGVGTLQIDGGTLDNTSGVAVIISPSIPQTWNATNVSFKGSSDLNLGTGAVTVASTNQTVTVSGTGVLTEGAALSLPVAGLLTKAGNGTFASNGNLTTGLLSLTGGTLNLSGTNAINGTAALTLLMSGGSTLNIISGFTTIAPNSFPLAYVGNSSRGNINILPGAQFDLGTGPSGFFMVGAGAGGIGVINNQGTMSNEGSLGIGWGSSNVAVPQTTSGVLYNTGIFTHTAPAAGGNGDYIGNRDNSYGYIRNTGTFTTNAVLRVGFNDNTGTNGPAGILDVLGGSVNVGAPAATTAPTTTLFFGLNNQATTYTALATRALLNVNGGTINVASTNIGTMQINNATNAYAVVNVVGSSSLLKVGNAANPSVIDLSVASSSTNTTFMTIAGGGVVETGHIQKTGAASISTISFNGGTLRADASAATVGNLINAGINTYVMSGGATVDSNGLNPTMAASLLAPSGSGVSSFTLGGTTTGYIGAPFVSITGGGGTGATAIAAFNPVTGTVTGITITSSGTGYTSAATFSLLGGSGAAAGAVAGSATITGVMGLVPTTGGFNKIGAGTLTFTGATGSTYKGGTTISGGTLVVPAPVAGVFQLPVATSGSSVTINPSTVLAVSPVAGTAPHTFASVSSSYFAFNGGQLDLSNNDVLITGGASVVGLESTVNLAMVAHTPVSSILTTTSVITGLLYSQLTGKTLFDGTAFGPTDLLLRYGPAGDITDSGHITIDDYILIDEGYAAYTANPIAANDSYAKGDLNHDGVINAADYALIDANALIQGNSVLADGMISLHTDEFGSAYTDALSADLGSPTAVPEPASLVVLGLGAIGLMTRRRRR